MTKTELISFFTMLFAVMIIVSTVAIIVFWRINTPEKMLAEINQTMQAYDPRHGFSVPDDQKDDCIKWAYGKDWKEIQWNNRGARFRDLHPELDPNDFSDATPILLYNERVSNAYLDWLDWKEKFTIYIIPNAPSEPIYCRWKDGIYGGVIELYDPNQQEGKD